MAQRTTGRAKPPWAGRPKNDLVMKIPPFFLRARISPNFIQILDQPIIGGPVPPQNQQRDATALRMTTTLRPPSVNYASGVFTANYYVATAGAGGSDSNPGTIGSPFLTINKATTTMSAGQIAAVRAGSYSAPSQTPPSGTSWSSATRVFAYPGETVTLTGRLNIGDQGARSYLWYKGFILTGSSNEGVWIGTASHHIRIESCEIKNAAKHGILFGHPDINDCEILNNYLHGGGSDPEFDNCVYICGKRNLVSGNEMTDWTGAGVQIWHDNTNNNDNVICYNKIHHTRGSNDDRFHGIIVARGQGMLVYNNLIYKGIPTGQGAGTGGAGIIVFSSGSGKIYNNTLYGGGSSGANYPGIEMQSSAASGVECKNNISYDHGPSNSINIINNAGATMSNNLESNPAFISTSSDNYHLQSSSSARNAGTSSVSSIVTDDLDHVSRPQGSAYDIGCYERD